MTRRWEPGCEYRHGDVVEYNGCYYRVIQPHRSEGTWMPDQTPALWGRLPEHEAERHKHHNQGQCGEQQQQQMPQGGGGYGYGGPAGGNNFGGATGQNNNYGSGGYGGNSGGQPSQVVPQNSEDPRKQQKDGFDLGGFHISKQEMEIGGGIIGTAAALGIGAFAYDKYKDSQEGKKDQQWASSNWEVDARRRQGEYLEAVRTNAHLPPVSWVLSDGANIPQGAIPGGKEQDGEILYIARAYHDHGVHVGKVSRKLKDGCHIAFGGKEIAVKSYEILLGYENAVRWVDCQGACNIQSERPVEGGREADGKPLYIAQAYVKNGVHPGKCGAHLTKGAAIPYGNDEKHENNYRVLVYA